jgi:hypothetical protein
MKRAIPILAVLLSAGCASWYGGPDEAAREFEKEAGAVESRVREDNARSSLGKIETSLADYYKSVGSIPPNLDKLVPKYLAEVPALNLPACGRETNKVEYYPPDILRDGQVDGTRIRGTGRWGYVYNDSRVVVFVDCLKPSSRGVPWYRERGVY